MSRSRRIRRGSEPTTTTNLSGLWTLNEIHNYNLRNKWPKGPTSVPDSPTNLVATLVGKDVSVSFSIPTRDGNSPITNYLVQYSSNNGNSWTSFAGIRLTSPITVNTLSYNKSYIFRVVAVNNIGNSIPSNYSNSVTTPIGIQGYLYGQFRRGGRPNDSEMLSGNILSSPLSSPSLYSSINYGENDDEYGFIAIGYFIPPTNGTYTFYTSSDDGSAVWIGSIAEASTGRSSSNMVVNNNVTGYQGDTERSGSIVLTAGTVYAIRIIHREGDGGDNLRFSWAGPGISKRESLASYFYANNFGSEPPTIISSIAESLNGKVDLYLVTSPAPTYYNISYSTNGVNYTVFGNGQTAPATPIGITGLTNNTTYSFKIVAINSVGSSDELLITNLTPSSSNIRPLSLGQAFLSNIYSDTVLDNEYDNLRLGQAFLSNIYSDIVLDNKYDNLRLGQAFLSNIYSDPI